MTKDFMIILDKRYSTKFLSDVIEENIKIEKKHRVSRNNHIMVAQSEGMLFDVESEFIKCRMLGKCEEKERAFVEKVIRQLGEKKIFVHFYGKENSLSPKLKII